MTARSKFNGRDVEWNEESKKWIYSDNKTEVGGTRQEIEQAMFDAKTKALHEAFERISKDFKIGFVASIYFKEQDLSGVHSYGKLNHIMEMGLAKSVEQKFIT